MCSRVEVTQNRSFAQEVFSPLLWAGVRGLGDFEVYFNFCDLNKIKYTFGFFRPFR